MGRDVWQGAGRRDAGRGWLSRRKRMGDRGATLRDINRNKLGSAMPVKGKRMDESMLTRQLGGAVLHLLGGTTQSPTLRATTKDTPAVSLAIKQVISLLPQPALVPRSRRGLFDHLRAAAARDRGA